jgi:hypothetical protein
MFTQPAMGALVIKYYQLEMSTQAERERLRRQVYPEVKVAKLKTPSRVPRFWRWRYLWAK